MFITLRHYCSSPVFVSLFVDLTEYFSVLKNYLKRIFIAFFLFCSVSPILWNPALKPLPISQPKAEQSMECHARKMLLLCPSHWAVISCVPVWLPTGILKHQFHVAGKKKMVLICPKTCLGFYFICCHVLSCCSIIRWSSLRNVVIGLSAYISIWS